MTLFCHSGGRSWWHLASMCFSARGFLGLGLSKAQGLARHTRLGIRDRRVQRYSLVNSLPDKHPWQQGERGAESHTKDT